MKEILDQFLQLLQQAIAAIFRFVGLVWAWSLDQINKMAQVPLENWPLWKQILLALVAAAVGYALFVAAWRLWVASIRAFAAFASGTGLRGVCVASAEIRRGRSDRDSSPWSTPPRSLSQTSPSRPHTHRLPPGPAAGNANRRSGRHACRST